MEADAGVGEGTNPTLKGHRSGIYEFIVSGIGSSWSKKGRTRSPAVLILLKCGCGGVFFSDNAMINTHLRERNIIWD
jgi:hypothetical protein